MKHIPDIFGFIWTEPRGPFRVQLGRTTSPPLGVRRRLLMSMRSDPTSTAAGRAQPCPTSARPAPRLQLATLHVVEQIAAAPEPSRRPLGHPPLLLLVRLYHQEPAKPRAPLSFASCASCLLYLVQHLDGQVEHCCWSRSPSLPARPVASALSFTAWLSREDYLQRPHPALA